MRDSIYVNQHSVGRTDERSGTRRKQRHGMKVTIESSEKLQTLSDLRQEISLPVIKELNSSKTLHAQLNLNTGWSACAAQPINRLNESPGRYVIK